MTDVIEKMAHSSEFPMNVMPSWAKICREYTFEAAHFLPDLPDGHKCKRMHGHSYKVSVMIEGPPDARGLVCGIEFGALDIFMDAAIIKQCDHHVWNDKLVSPTVEHIAAYIAKIVSGGMKVPCTVRVQEGPRSWAEVTDGA